MNKTCVYYCEGENDQNLIDALKVNPEKILPGKSKKLNVGKADIRNPLCCLLMNAGCLSCVQTLIPKSILLGIKSDTNVVLVFDTDVITNLDIIKKNIDNIKKYCRNVKIVYLLQVKNLEDELVRCTDIKTVLELTKSKSLSNFKTDFRKLNAEQCRYTLERHKINVERLWRESTPEKFDFVERNSQLIKK